LTWQFDRGSEFLNSTFEEWLLLQLGVKQTFSNVEHPWENGKAERSFQTIFALTRSLLKHADLPIKMWGKAILHAAYIMNRTPCSNAGGLAPLQYRTKEPIDLSNMRVFGSPAQIHVRKTRRDDNKLSDRSISGTFIGHSRHGNGYLFLVPKSPSNRNLGTHQCVEIDSRDVKFNETFSPCRERQGKLSMNNEIDPDLTSKPEHDPGNVPGRKPNPAHSESNADIDSDEDSIQDETTMANEYGRGLRQSIPRQFLHPGTQSKDTYETY
jgi:hypothetical protein